MRTVFGVVGITLAATALPASAQAFFGVTRGGRLLQVDVASQSVSSVGSVSVGANSISGLEDCDFNASGQLYAVGSTTQSGFPPITVNRTYRINTGSAAALLGSDLGSLQVHSLAFESVSSFYSVNFTGGFPAATSGNLLHLDPATGAFSSVSGAAHGLPGSFRVDALALSPAGLLYGVWDGGSAFLGTHDYKLVSFNRTSGAGTVIGSIGTGSQSFESLRFDDAGTAYTVDSVTGNVFSVNLTNGQGNFLFAGGSLAQGLTGLAYIPAPGSLCVMGGFLMIGTRRRRD